MSLFEHSTKYQQSFISLFYLLLGLLIGIFAQSLWNGFIFFSMRMKGTETAKTILYPEKPPQVRVSHSHFDSLNLISCINQVPRHIAVIMDGNRRFGRRKHADPLQVTLYTIMEYLRQHNFSDPYLHRDTGQAVRL